MPSALRGCAVATSRGARRADSTSAAAGYRVKAANRLSPLNCAASTLKIAALSAPACNWGRPVYPRGARYSVVPRVDRITSSPSPTTGDTVYIAHRPSLDSTAPEIVRQRS